MQRGRIIRSSYWRLPKPSPPPRCTASFDGSATTVNWNRVLVVLGIVNVVLIIGIWIARLVDGSIPRFF